MEAKEIQIKPIKTIPQKLLDSFLGTPGVKTEDIGEIKATPTKFGAIFKGEIIGFIAARDFPVQKARDLSVRGFHVLKRYQRKGIGRRLLYRIIGTAKKRGLEVDIGRTSRPSRKLLEKEMHLLKKREAKKPFEIKLYDRGGGMNIGAVIKLRKRRK